MDLMPPTPEYNFSTMSAHFDRVPLDSVQPFRLITTTNISFGRIALPVPLPSNSLDQSKKRDKLGCGYVEHGYIGDAISITLPEGARISATDHPFTLHNGLVVTYGEIEALAGELYGTDSPISDGKTADEQAVRFLEAYGTLADMSPRQPHEARELLRVLKRDLNAINDALRRHQPPSVVYDVLPDVTSQLEDITMNRRAGFPSYLGLARINWDHFGADARTCYNVGHAVALQMAADGDLEQAYALNAFADRFLEDCFSAGRLRTPRRSLHRPIDAAADICAKYMHDEDAAIGLSVKNPAGRSWDCYGHGRALDRAAATNLKCCVAAIQASADEVYEAYSGNAVLETQSYKAWAFAPTLESVHDVQTLTPLFTYSEDGPKKDVLRRKTIASRRCRAFTTDWCFQTTALECHHSRWWGPAITTDGQPRILPWTDFAIVGPRGGCAKLYYQDASGGVLESVYTEARGRWEGGVNDLPLFDAALGTPLAAVGWPGGSTNKRVSEIRVFYLDREHRLRESRCILSQELEPHSWVAGSSLDKLDIRVSADGSISAFSYLDRGASHARVFYQDANTDHIKELYYDGGTWSRGAVLPVALKGTSIAAIVLTPLRFRVYYQDDDLSIREHCFNLGENWFEGKFRGAKAPGRTPIRAIATRKGVKTGMDVCWMNADQEIVHSVHNAGPEGWRHGVVAVDTGSLRAGSKFALAQWEEGDPTIIYYRSAVDSVEGVAAKA
ncbi:fungal fucose-specific lectin-domain-containing protein [Trametes maxima]|nr:fungal fucose-specific lectin-domain-containing protein [Trametes maxima]